MAAQRGPNGRFIKGTGSKTKTAVTKAIKSVFSVGETINRKLKTTLEVFEKKSIEGNPANMRAGSDVILEMLEAKGPTGTHIVRVKKPESRRIFYTIEEKLQVAI